MLQVRFGSADHTLAISVAEIRTTAAVTVQVNKSCAGIPAVVFGKALYEGRITLKDLKRFM